MLHRLPSHVPALSAMLEDLGQPGPRALARSLGVSQRSVQRWIAADCMPRAAGLALYPLTRWGASAAECQAYNEAQLAKALARSLSTENQRLRQLLTDVLRLADFGSANAPSFSEPVPATRGSASSSAMPSTDAPNYPPRNERHC